MSHLPFTLTAYFFNAAAVLVDKILLKRNIGHPLTYVFYISAASLLSMVVVFFAPLPTLTGLILASISTLLWTTGAYFMFAALKDGQVSRVIPVINTLVPIFLLVAGLSTASLTQNQALAVSLLILGILSITLPYWRGEFTYQEIKLEFLSAIFFTVSYLVLHQAYLQSNFLAILGWSRLVLIPLLLIFVLLPQCRKLIFASKEGQPHFKLLSKVGLLFAGGQVAGGTSEFLITYSISLANPALVNSLLGVQYVFLFIGSLLLARKYPQIFNEKFTFLNITGKVAGFALLAGGLYLIA